MVDNAPGNTITLKEAILSLGGIIELLVKDRLAAFERMLNERYTTLEKQIIANFSAHAREHVLHADAHLAKHLADEKAIDRANKANDERLAIMNEFRGTISDQTANFVTISVMNALIDRVMAAVAGTNEAVARMEREAALKAAALQEDMNRRFRAIEDQLAIERGRAEEREKAQIRDRWVTGVAITIVSIGIGIFFNVLRGG